MKRFVVFLTALIPLALFWLVILSLDPMRIVPETPHSAPKWIEENTYKTCSDAMSGTPVTIATPIVDEKRAVSLGAGVIQTQSDLLTLSGKNIVAFKPALVERQFPDNQSHLAWVWGEGRVTD